MWLLSFDNRFQTKIEDLFSVDITGFFQKWKEIPFNQIFLNVALNTQAPQKMFHALHVFFSQGKQDNIQKPLRMSQRRSSQRPESFKEEEIDDFWLGDQHPPVFRPRAEPH